VDDGLLLSNILERRRGFRNTGRRKTDNRYNENSGHVAPKLERLYEVTTVGKAAAVLAASIFHFGEISIREAEENPREQGISTNIETTWFVNKLGSQAPTK
jgi:hypothetical protein